mmetsp:Transcript_16393/g.35160  ORF Transcript_16393/g.35160 Transcript_16393/m.35160 type:complete len:229 (-) Transcript_16393:326-1012(-)
MHLPHLRLLSLRRIGGDGLDAVGVLRDVQDALEQTEHLALAQLESQRDVLCPLDKERRDLRARCLVRRLLPSPQRARGGAEHAVRERARGAGERALVVFLLVLHRVLLFRILHRLDTLLLLVGRVVGTHELLRLGGAQLLLGGVGVGRAGQREQIGDDRVVAALPRLVERRPAVVVLLEHALRVDRDERSHRLPVPAHRRQVQRLIPAAGCGLRCLGERLERPAHHLV